MRKITYVSSRGIVVRGKSQEECRRAAERLLAETRLARAVTFTSRDGARSFAAHAPGYAHADR